MKGIESLKAAVIRDTEKGGNCFNEAGCDKPRCPCFHRYCDKFKWVIDRADHYAEKLGTTRDDVLEAWESSRDYWYMNFYQDSNQPLIEGDNVRVFETPEDLSKALTKREFRCPRCEGVSTDPYECSQDNCDWKAFGLFRTLGKGITVLSRKPIAKTHIFMPIEWETVNANKSSK